MSSKKITKNDLLESVHAKTKLDKDVVQRTVESLFEQLKESLKDGCTIELRGFGTFEPRLRKGRENARNPKTGQTLNVASHYVVAFRSGRELKNALLSLPVEENS
jgi:integration host factor subunit beta